MLGLMQVSIAFHYCGDTMKYVSLHEAEERESCCGKMEQHGCCSDEQITYKVDDQYFGKVVATQRPAFTDIILPEHSTPNFFSVEYPVFEVHQVSHSPPLIHKYRLHLMNNVFLI